METGSPIIPPKAPLEGSGVYSSENEPCTPRKLFKVLNIVLVSKINGSLEKLFFIFRIINQSVTPFTTQSILNISLDEV